jgi:hypothetical protein
VGPAGRAWRRVLRAVGLWWLGWGLGAECEAQVLRRMQQDAKCVSWNKAMAAGLWVQVTSKLDWQSRQHLSHRTDHCYPWLFCFL